MADVLYRELYFAWKEAYPRLKGDNLTKEVSSYWRSTFQKTVPKTEEVVRQRIESLRERACRIQPTLATYWAKQAPSKAQETTNEKVVKKSLPSSSTSVVCITIDDDDDDDDEEEVPVKNVDNKPSPPLIVLEVVTLGQQENANSKAQAITQPLSTHSFNSSELTKDYIKTETLATGGDAKTIQENDYVGLIRIRKLETLMEHPE